MSDKPAWDKGLSGGLTGGLWGRKPTRITTFHFMLDEDGSRRLYTLSREEGPALLEFSRDGESYERVPDAPDALFDSLQETVERHNLYKWNNFFKDAPEDAPGGVFALYIRYDGDRSISARGAGGARPSGFDGVRDELLAFFAPLCP